DGAGVPDDQRPGAQRSAQGTGKSARAIAVLGTVRSRSGGRTLLGCLDPSAERQGIGPGDRSPGGIQRQAKRARGPDLGVAEREGIRAQKIELCQVIDGGRSMSSMPRIKTGTSMLDTPRFSKSHTN